MRLGLGLVLAAALLMPGAALAQGTIRQVDAVTPGHLGMFTASGQMRDAGGPATANGKPQNSALAGRLPSGLGIVNSGLGYCQWTGYASAAYGEFCWGFDGSGNALIKIARVGAGTPPSLSIDLNGSIYGFPGAGGGNVVGPSPTTVNELASWNSTAGTALRQGPATLTDSKTAAITAEGGSLLARSSATYTANQVLQFTFGAAAGVPTGTTFDALRAVAYVPAGTTVSLTNGIAAYVVSDLATNPATGFPTGNGIFAAVVARANNAKVWGINTLLTDTDTYAVSAGTGKSLNNEFDFNVTSPNTTVIGLQLAGSSVAQPASAVGIALQPLDAPLFGTVSRWTTFLQSTAGATNTFASIAAKQNTGTSIKSQDLTMHFKTSAGADGNVVLTGAEAGGLEVFSALSLARAVTITGGAGRFAVADGGGFNINNRIVLTGTGAAFAVGGDTGYTTQDYGNAAAATSILGANVTLAAQAGGKVIANQALKLPVVAVGALPACNGGAAGAEIWVFDSSVASFNAAVAGGGASVVKAGCDGTTWRVH